MVRTHQAVVVLVGPTASGKTALLDAVFGSRASREAYGLPEAEIVCADSMQAYRGMDIGTAKPDSALRSRLPHALIDIRGIGEQYTVGDFVRLADEACERISERGRLPVVSGGTAFYLRNFICGLPGAPAADPRIRTGVALDLSTRGAAALRAELAAVDPVSAARIHENDLYRLTRALEIIRLTGRPMAQFAPSEEPRAGRSFAVFGIAPPPGELALRIGERVEAMIAAGLANEVAGLRAAGHGTDEPGMRAIGYREFFESGPAGSVGRESPPGGLEAIVERIKLDSRRYAKRQMTFFRKLPGIEWIDPSPEEFASRVSGIVRGVDTGL
jgi:tRNA dimethylallyltransferase